MLFLYCFIYFDGVLSSTNLDQFHKRKREREIYIEGYRERARERDRVRERMRERDI